MLNSLAEYRCLDPYTRRYNPFVIGSERIRPGLAGVVRLAIASLLAVGVAGISLAERLPMRRYTTADGLAHDRVVRIVPDSRGFLWFCTLDGLSRFDGVQFVSYPLQEGISYFDIAEGPDGVYWIGIWRGGLARLDPQARDSSKAIEPVPGWS